MILAASLDDQNGAAVTLHRTATRRLTSANGLVGTGPLRDVTRPRPTGHGVLNDTRWQDGQPISLEGLIVADTNALAMADMHTIAGTALATLDYGAALLKWTEEGGLTLQRSVKLAGPLDPPLTPQPRSLAYQLQFLAEDPRAYAQTLTTVTGNPLSVSAGGLIFPVKFPFKFTPSGGGAATAVNAGNRRTPPIFRVYGTATNPQILNVDTGERIVLSNNGVTVNAGDYLEVDVANRTVELNGTSNYQQAISSSSTTWFDLPAATSNIRLLADSFDASARVDVLFRSAYA